MTKEKAWFRHYPPQVPRSITIPKIPVSQILTNSANRSPEDIALVFAPIKAEMTYGELEEKSNRFAGALQQMIKKGDKVAMLLPNCLEMAIAFFGTLKAGGVIVPLNPRYTPNELQHVLADSGTKAMICFEQMYPMVAQIKEGVMIENIITVSMGPPSDIGIPFQRLVAGPLNYKEVEILPNDIAVIQYTAGTTGLSKGVMITHKNIVSNVLQLNAFCWPMEKEKETFVVVVPPFHVAGLVNVISWGIYIGAKLVLLPKFNPAETMETITQYKSSFFFGVPAIYAAMLGAMQEQYKFDSLKFCAIGTASCPLPLFQILDTIFPALTEGYGLTESTGVCFANPIDGLKKAKSVGIPFSGVDVKIVDVDSGKKLNPGEKGEILIKGPNIALGYWNHPEETEKVFGAGWLHTGDIGCLDEDGYLYVIDRIKDVINVRGEKVSSVEIEQTLESHPSIAEAAAIGVPDQFWGEKIIAFVVLREPQSVKLILAHCQKNLTDYKVPQEIRIVESLPRSGVGKILKRKLREDSAS